MKAIKLIFGIVIIGLSFTSCDKDENVKTIGSDILVSTKIQNNDVYILAETLKEFECSTYSIDFTTQLHGNIITIEFLDVVKPDGCYGAFEPARTFVIFSYLESKEYVVKFKLDGEVTEAKLYVDTSANLEFTTAGNVRLK